ncbi:MAG: hypothetical protein JXR56_07425, partial [Candidatus Cloacimonetes bacterium]|nr:hypothetical protein [Candidatus Cloacimonadota bacterium]
MVNPIYIIAMFLAAAFMVALTDKVNRKVSLTLFYLTTVIATGAGAFHIWELITGQVQDAQVFTAGFAGPISIVLGFGLKETVLITLINMMGIFSAIFFTNRLSKGSYQPVALLLLILLGANGLVMTRDIFNTFVFLEILSIATYAMIGIKPTKGSLSAGFKYMMAGGVASILLLIGIIFTYKYTGTLNLDAWISMDIPLTAGYKVAVFLLAMAVFIELKPFPANGWALDVYESAHSGIGAIVSTINTGALLYLLYKLIPALPEVVVTLMAGAGLFSFLLSNLTGLRQQSSRRLLGYSSTAQTGLIIFVMGGLARFGIQEIYITYFAAGLFITNFFAKAGLFWLSGITGSDKISEWGSLRKYPLLVILFSIFIVALTGFPPFPSFLAKWEIVKILAENSAWLPLATILIGSLLEAGYMFKWLGYAIRKDETVSIFPKDMLSRIIPITVVGITLVVLSFQNASDFYRLDMSIFLPIIGLLVFSAIDTLSVKIKGFIAIAVLGAWSWFFLLPYLSGIGLVFGGILIIGSLIQLFGFMHYEGAQKGLFPLLVMMIISLGNILVASSTLVFFFSWELMTLSSYFLITRGKFSFKPALTYILFSLGGAYLLLTGLNLLPGFVEGIPLYAQSPWMNIGILPAILLALGFLIKLGALGVHVWLPDAYTEAEDEFTAILSSVLSKAGVFGLLLVLIMARSVFTSNYFLTEGLGWLGVLTAFFGALMAVFQEDVKKLLAYSSMSQLGYIVLSFSLMSHLGWVSALYMTINHFFFKALILMAVAGVIFRTKTRWMYEMGGLIKKMPISFISVLLGIIAVSGVPPLSGFGGKWLVYTSLMEKGHYLQAGLAFFSSAVAFLYLYRLIHTVFLGQAKPMFKDVKEAPIWLLIPQVVFMMAIMGISMFPNLITMPLSRIVGDYIIKPEWLSWTGYNITLGSDAIHGNWNGNLVMLVTMGVFIVPLAWLLLVVGKVQTVKQFNIVFAAERPFKPWTTHFAYNMFAPYYKALGFLIQPRATAFWNGVGEWSRSLSST